MTTPLWKALLFEGRLPSRYNLFKIKKKLHYRLLTPLAYLGKRKREKIFNVGIVTTWFERGAAYVSKQYMDVLEEKYNVFVYARGGEKSSKGNPEWDKGNVFYDPNIGNDGVNTDIDMFLYYKWIKRNKIDLLIFNEQQSFLEPVLLAKKMGVRCFAYIDYYTKEGGSCPPNSFKIYDGCFCNTKRHYNALSRFNRNTHFVQWGTDLKLFDKQSFRRKKKAVFFHNAGLWGSYNRKGTDYVIQAWNKLRKKDAELIIHSQIDPRCSIPKDVKVITEEKGPPGFYHMGDVYVYPSKLEGIGLSICEAMAAGLPVITTNNAPMNEFVKHNVNGRLINVREYKTRKDLYYWDESLVDVDDLARQMQYYIDHPDKIREHGRNSRSLCEGKFNWANNGKKIIEAIKNIR